MQCDQIMSRKPFFLSADQPASEAAAQMRSQNVSLLPVCDAQQHVVGALSERDLVLRLVAEARSAGTPVGELMSHDVQSVHAQDDTQQAATKLAECGVARLVCLDAEGRLVGMVHRDDLPQAHGLHTSFSPAFGAMN